MLAWALRDLRRDWPWLIYSASDAWVVGFMVFNQWRRRRHAARYDEPLLAHVEWSIKDIEDRMLQDRYSVWWYVLPLALGCMIPPTLFFAMNHGRDPSWRTFGALLLTLGGFAAVFTFVHLCMKYGRRKAHEQGRRELEALRSASGNPAQFRGTIQMIRSLSVTWTIALALTGLGSNALRAAAPPPPKDVSALLAPIVQKHERPRHGGGGRPERRDGRRRRRRRPHARQAGEDRRRRPLSHRLGHQGDDRDALRHPRR